MHMRSMFTLALGCLSLAAASVDLPANATTIGTGLSQLVLAANQTTTVFEHKVADGWGVMTHFWIAALPQADGSCMDAATVSYFVDGEADASIQFQPSQASAVGFDDQAVFGIKWVGKGAKTSGWFNNLKIPFRSIRITVQPPTKCTAWIVLRGNENLPLVIEGLALPRKARMKLVNTRRTLQPLEFLDLVHFPDQRGWIFMTMMEVTSKNLLFLEGCYHMYDPPAAPWPGTVIATGTEDYFDSAFYFNGGTFHFANAGNTHLRQEPGHATWSGYRLHTADPLLFKKGVRFQWRNGDVTDPATGLKCTQQEGGTVAGGSPEPLGTSDVFSMAWVYVWP